MKDIAIEVLIWVAMVVGIVGIRVIYVANMNTRQSRLNEREREHKKYAEIQIQRMRQLKAEKNIDSSSKINKRLTRYEAAYNEAIMGAEIIAELEGKEQCPSKISSAD